MAAYGSAPPLPPLPRPGGGGSITLSPDLKAHGVDEGGGGMSTRESKRYICICRNIRRR
jgi:hypothetical protein